MLPSIVVGATVGIGITWAVVVAAEMISGGGSAGSMGGAAGGGLGFFIWNSYVGGSYTQIVAGMISIGIAGYISSALLRKIGRVDDSLAGGRLRINRNRHMQDTMADSDVHLARAAPASHARQPDCRSRT